MDAHGTVIIFTIFQSVDPLSTARGYSSMQVRIAVPIDYGAGLKCLHRQVSSKSIPERQLGALMRFSKQGRGAFSSDSCSGGAVFCNGDAGPKSVFD